MLQHVGGAFSGSRVQAAVRPSASSTRKIRDRLRGIQGTLGLCALAVRRGALRSMSITDAVSGLHATPQANDSAACSTQHSRMAIRARSAPCARPHSTNAVGWLAYNMS